MLRVPIATAPPFATAIRAAFAVAATCPTTKPTIATPTIPLTAEP